MRQPAQEATQPTDSVWAWSSAITEVLNYCATETSEGLLLSQAVTRTVHRLMCLDLCHS